MRALAKKHRDAAQLAAALTQAGLPASVGTDGSAGAGKAPAPISSPVDERRGTAIPMTLTAECAKLMTCDVQTRGSVAQVMDG